MARTVEELVQALKDPDRRVRGEAARALGQIGLAAVPALAETVRVDLDPVVRANAARALGVIGPAAKDAVPALTEAFKDEDADVRRWAAWALRWIQG